MGRTSSPAPARSPMDAVVDYAKRHDPEALDEVHGRYRRLASFGPTGCGEPARGDHNVRWRPPRENRIALRCRARGNTNAWRIQLRVAGECHGLHHASV